jgi:endonuclease/exonuclease/phosphatase family metal-dependent hydrolase
VRHVPVGAFDATTGQWTDIDAGGAVDRDELTLTTFNIWFNSYLADERYGAIAELLSRDLPDVMVFEEVSPSALTLFLAQPWIREHYLRAAVIADVVGNYGMLMLSRVPVTRVTYTRLPTRLARGFLRAELTINGMPQVVCSVHLESGKAAARLRAWQLRRVFRALRTAENAVILGDFNMRDNENGRIPAPYCDVWPALRPRVDGFTEDTPSTSCVSTARTSTDRSASTASSSKVSRGPLQALSYWVPSQCRVHCRACSRQTTSGLPTRPLSGRTRQAATPSLASVARAPSMNGREPKAP